jgi:Flp pilus assembly protein TadD
MHANHPEHLTSEDCVFLTGIFERECRRLFPVPATAHLYLRENLDSYLVGKRLPDTLQKAVPADRSLSTPRYSSGFLFLPLKLAGGEKAVFIFSDTDPVLLKKFSPSWLLDFQDMLQQHMELVKQVYIDPETGLYNRRALNYFVEHAASGQATGALFLINISFVRRSTRGSSLKVRYLAGLLSAISPGILFFLGQGMFALFVDKKNKQERLAYGHRLQRRLKREGLQKVHIAFSAVREGNEHIFEETREALAVAERRGPFGLCDTAALQGTESGPFALPEGKILRKLRRLWRGVDSFGLVLFSREPSAQPFDPLSSLLTPLLSEEEHGVSLSSDQLFVFIPTPSSSRFESRVKKLTTTINTPDQPPVSAGFCFFPCLQFTKTDAIRNCRKAIMHGGFYGPGSVVAFDHLSLNVSGDWYFDEGDFRQAVREYSQGLKLHPGEKNLLNSLGVALMEMNRYHAAITSFNEVLQKDPDNHMALVNLGYAYQLQGNDAAALEHFEKAFSVQYHSGIAGTDVFLQLSRLYCRSGRYKEALPVLSRWRQVKESDGEFMLHRLLGKAYGETGRTSQAMESLQRALQLYPHDVESMSMLGLLYVEQEEGEEAGLLLLEKALALDETNSESWYRLARALMHLHREKEALDGVRKCLRLRRGNPRAMFLHGKILADMKRMKQARGVLRRLVKMKDARNNEKRKAERLLSTLSEQNRIDNR